MKAMILLLVGVTLSLEAHSITKTKIAESFWRLNSQKASIGQSENILCRFQKPQFVLSVSGVWRWIYISG
jgi:hypothetical protein